MEDAFAESYNNKNTDSKYYSEDAVSFSNGKMPGRKKAIHESMKVNYSPSKGSKIAFETQKYMLQTMEIW
jgi:hypothetical protein